MISFSDLIVLIGLLSTAWFFYNSLYVVKDTSTALSLIAIEIDKIKARSDYSCEKEKIMLRSVEVTKRFIGAVFITSLLAMGGGVQLYVFSILTILVLAMVYKQKSAKEEGRFIKYLRIIRMAYAIIALPLLSMHFVVPKISNHVQSNIAQTSCIVVLAVVFVAYIAVVNTIPKYIKSSDAD